MLKKFILSTVGVVCLTSSTSAVEAGKLYIRGDTGYGIARTDATASSTMGTTISSGLLKNVNPSGFVGSIGVGYNYNDRIRTDITVNIAKYNYNSNLNLKLKSQYISAMASVYYDFNNSSNFTPYIMGGIGFAQKDIDFQKIEEGDAGFSIKSKKSNTIAY